MLTSSSLEQTALAKLPTPAMALLFHTSGNSLSLVTAHEIIRDRSGQSHIGPGRVALPSDEVRLASLLGTRNRRGRITLNPPDVLFNDEATLAWWIPPAIRPMFLQDANGAHAEVMVHWPSLVGLVVNRKLHVVALASQTRPALGDAVFHAPVGNVYSDTAVCTGSARLPTGTSVVEMDAWTHVVTGTYFTHDNHGDVLARPKAKKSKRSATLRNDNYRATAYWRERNGCTDPMPLADLVPLNLTLADWLEAIIDGSDDE